MITYICVFSFFLILLFIAFFIMSDIKGKKTLPSLLLAAFFFLLLVTASALNERNINAQLIEIYNSNDRVYAGRTGLSEYDKKRNKYEMDIISSSNWNKAVIDPIESGNLKLAAEVLKRAIIRTGMSLELKDYIMDIKANPENFIGLPFVGEVEFESFKLLEKEDQITKTFGNEKVAVYSKLSTEDAVIYINNDNNRCFDGMSEIQGIFVGVSQNDGKEYFVFVGR